MKRAILFTSIIMVIFSFTSLLADEQPVVIPAEIVEVLAQNCPVMGGGVDKAVFTIHEGHIYYFCCPGCIGSFNADPAKFIEILKDAPTRILKVTNIDGKCPVSGLAASLQFFKVDEKTATITFFSDEKSIEK